MSTCVNVACVNDGRLHLKESDGKYRGASWCSVRCLLATSFSALASAYPDNLVERPEVDR